MKNFYTLLIICSLLIASTSCGSQSKAENEAESNDISIDSSELANNDATILFEKLMDSFSSDWRENEPAPESYPEYFGGVFIDNDNVLTIAIVGDVNTHKKDIEKRIGSNKFNTESCTYSYRELMQVMNKIDVFLTNTAIPEDHIIIQNFGGALADVFENRVIVNLLAVNDETTQAFKRDISDSNAVKFKEGNLFEME